MPHAPNGRTRIRFDDFTHRSGPDGRCRVSVALEWGGRRHQRSSEGLETLHGRLSASAKATLAAVAATAEEAPAELQVVGIKAVKAFDGWVVVTRINGRSPERTYRLLGSAPCETEDELPRTAARAVLNAINRIVPSYVP